MGVVCRRHGFFFAGFAVAIGMAAAAAVVGSSSGVAAAARADAAAWSGTFESDSQRIYVFSDGGGAQCNDHWHANLSFVIGSDARLTGAGTMKLTDGPKCSGRID